MTGRKPSDLEVEQLLLGELSPERARAVQAALEAHDDERMESLRRSNASILADYPSAEIARQIQRRLDRVEDVSPTPRGWLWMPVAAIGVALAAALVWVMVNPRRNLRGPHPTNVVAMRPDGLKTSRLKGDRDPMLWVHRNEGQQSEVLKSGDTAQIGDRLWVHYRAGDARHGVILSIDGAAVVTLHFPATETASTRLAAGANVALSDAYVLDDAPAFERFVFLTAEQAMDVGAILQAVRQQASALGPKELETTPIAVEGDIHQRSFVLRKP